MVYSRSAVSKCFHSWSYGCLLRVYGGDQKQHKAKITHFTYQHPCVLATKSPFHITSAPLLHCRVQFDEAFHKLVSCLSVPDLPIHVVRVFEEFWRVWQGNQELMPIDKVSLKEEKPPCITNTDASALEVNSYLYYWLASSSLYFT